MSPRESWASTVTGGCAGLEPHTKVQSTKQNDASPQLAATICISINEMTTLVFAYNNLMSSAKIQLYRDGVVQYDTEILSAKPKQHVRLITSLGLWMCTFFVPERLSNYQCLLGTRDTKFGENISLLLTVTNRQMKSRKFIDNINFNTRNPMLFTNCE